MADTWSLQEIVTYGGTILGTGVAAFLFRLGWRRAPATETEFAITGQSHITDMAPVRDLIKNIDLLTLQMQKAAIHDERRTEALENLAEVLTKFLNDQTERQEKQDIEAEVSRRVAEKLKSQGMEPATQQIRNP
jgi:hypothetical protein